MIAGISLLSKQKKELLMIKNNYIKLAYSPMYGGSPNSDFLFIAMDEPWAKYF